jgi:hypothetical protein
VARDVLVDHPGIVHLIDVITGKDEHDLRIVASENVEVLEDCVGGSFVPICRNALLSREQFDEFIKTSVEKRPPPLDVMNQALSFVLGCDPDAPNARVNAIRQREVDNAKFSAERHGRLRTPVGKRPQARSPPTREHDSERLLRKMSHGRRIRLILLIGAKAGVRIGRRFAHSSLPIPATELCRSRVKAPKSITATNGK